MKLSERIRKLHGQYQGMDDQEAIAKGVEELESLLGRAKARLSEIKWITGYEHGGFNTCEADKEGIRDLVADLRKASG